MSSHLEYFIPHPETTDFLRYVKKVAIQICSPYRSSHALNDVHRYLQACAERLALRERLQTERLLTMQRLLVCIRCSVDEMSGEQILYCQQYHRTLVELFIYSQR